ELEGSDAALEERFAMGRQAAVGEDAGVNRRVERLHPAVEDLGKARDRADVGDRQARLAQGSCRSTGRDELETALDQASPEIGQAALVADGQQRSSRSRKRGVRTRF